MRPYILIAIPLLLLTVGFAPAKAQEGTPAAAATPSPTVQRARQGPMDRLLLTYQSPPPDSLSTIKHHGSPSSPW